MITKEKFQAFERVRARGVINMLDMERGTMLTGLTEAEYKEIIGDYSKYSKQFQ